MATNEDFNQQIRKKLLELYRGGKEKKDAEDFVTLLIFLDREVMMEKDQKYVSPFNQTLKLVLEMSNDLVLKEYTDRMLDDAKAIQKDPNVHKEMVKIYNQLTKPNSDQLLDEKFYLASNLDKSICEQSGGLGFLSGLREIMKNVPESEVRQILKAVQTVAKPFAANYSALSYVDEVVTVFSKTAGKVALVGLAAVFLAWECYSNMKKWWAGEISGKRCAKNCIDSFSGIAGGMVGGVAGAAIGSAIFPVVGTCVAGILGGLLSAWSAKVLSDAITRKIFDIPKDQALENAYNFLKVHHTASNNEINKHFHQLCFKHHPDKGGKHEDFLLLQYHMATIKISREESGRLPVTAPPKQIIMCNCQNQSEQQKSSSTQLQ